MKHDFLQEIAMMKKVASGKNRHVVGMIGCCIRQEPLALVLEYVPNGNLLDYLREMRTAVSGQWYSFYLLMIVLLPRPMLKLGLKKQKDLTLLMMILANPKFMRYVFANIKQKIVNRIMGIFNMEKLPH